MSETLDHALFRPRTIALIGASDDPGKVAGRPLRFLRQHGFAGEIWPVNPMRETVLEEPAFASLDALPGTPDHAYILLPAAAASDAVAACVIAGVPVVSVLADGFSESGQEGRAREDRLRGILAGTGTRLLGPQCLGVINLHHRMALTANAAFAEPALPAGGLMVASHSGSMLGALLSRGIDLGLGFSRMVSLGNEADLTLGEVCAGAAEDDAVTGFLLFLETLRGRHHLAAFAAAAWQAGKPVIAYRLGRTAAGAQLTRSHTGALLADGAATDAFLRDCGIALVESLEGLLEAAPLLGMPPPAPETGVAVVSTTGGGGGMVVEQLARAGVPLAEFGAESRAAFASNMLPAPTGPLLDVTLAGTRPEVMGAALDQLAAAPETALTVAVVGSSARFQPELAVRAVVSAARDGRPLAAFLNPSADESLRHLAARGVPAFRTPESLADAAAAWMRRRPPKAGLAAAPAGPAPDDAGPLPEPDGLAFLTARGIATVDHVVVTETPTTPLPFPFPVVAKGIAPGVSHKTEHGLVRLNLQDAAALAAAVDGLMAHPECQQVLIAPMVNGLMEVLVGFARDPVAGPVVMLAPGGVLAEIYDDRAVRTAPIALNIAREMIAEVRGLAPITGYRNLPPGDIEALARILVAMSELASTPVAEAEINPLIVRAAGGGAVAVDAVVVAAGGAGAGTT